MQSLNVSSEQKTTKIVKIIIIYILVYSVDINITIHVHVTLKSHNHAKLSCMIQILIPLHEF